MYIPAQGTGVPSHTAPRGALYYRTSTNLVYIQTAGPTGTTWTLLVPASTGMSDLVDDTTPQLGGDLDLNGHVITGLQIGVDVQAYNVATMLGTQNLNDLSSKPTAFANLVDSLSAGTTLTTAHLLGFSTIGGGHKKTVQQLFNIINLLTAETAPVYNDKLPLYDTSASQADALTIASLFGHGKAVVVSYTGSGSSGKTVTLTGINRAYFMIWMRDDTTANVALQFVAPGGGTGTRNIRFSNDGSTLATVNLDAPGAGTAQTLTINNTYANDNASGGTYRILVVGTPT